MTGYLYSIETMSTKDGPGIRVVIFMQGCKLRCLFCHNPETWGSKYNLEMTPQELISRILKYKDYFNNNGGITFSGGEPLLQPQFLIETLKLCHDFGINTCLDTAGCGVGQYEEILKYVDLVILDIKAITEKSYLEMTNHSINEFNKFLSTCQKLKKRLWLRQVIVPGINDTEEYILNLKSYIKNIANVDRVELLPYHTMAISKYKDLNLVYKLEKTPDLDMKKLEELNKILAN